jgi:hypothetical protein
MVPQFDIIRRRAATVELQIHDIARISDFRERIVTRQLTPLTFGVFSWTGHHGGR